MPIGCTELSPEKRHLEVKFRCKDADRNVIIELFKKRDRYYYKWKETGGVDPDG